MSGTLLAKGTEEHHIVFTSAQETPNPGDWNGLFFSSVGSNSELMWCVIEYGINGVACSASRPTIRYSKIRNNSSDGIYVSAEAHGCSGSGANPTITGCQIESNGAYGIRFAGRGNPIIGCVQPKTGSANGTVSSCKIRHNGLSGIGVLAYDGYQSNGNASPKIMHNQISGNMEHGIKIAGNDPTSPTVFNNDIFENVASGIHVQNSSGIKTIAYNRIFRNSHRGIYNIDEDIIIEDNQIKENLGYGIETSKLASFVGNSLFNNGAYDFFFTAQSDQIAKYNYWGTTSTSEIDQRIHDYFDDSKLGRVEYQPFYTVPDPIPPTVISTDPRNDASDVFLNVSITAQFSEPMNASTITTATFTVNDGEADIQGAVTYNENIAVFSPSKELNIGTRYTVTITNGVKDTAGNHMELSHTWSFTTGRVVESFTLPIHNPTDLAFDGTNLWCAGVLEDKIYKLDLEGNVIDSFDAPGTKPSGLTFDGTYLWCADADTDKIYRLDTAGNVIEFFDAPGTNPYFSDPSGLAFDGIYLWCVDSYQNIYKLDLAGNVIGFIDSPGTFTGGLAFDGIHLWHSSTFGQIYNIHPSGKIIDSFAPPTGSVEGLTFDGTYLWCVGSNNSTIYKLKVVRHVMGGDVNYDGDVNLTDLILALQISTGTAYTLRIVKEADVNADGLIGLAEGAYILRKIGGLSE